MTSATCVCQGFSDVGSSLTKTMCIERRFAKRSITPPCGVRSKPPLCAALDEGSSQGTTGEGEWFAH